MKKRLFPTRIVSFVFRMLIAFENFIDVKKILHLWLNNLNKWTSKIK